MCIFCLNDVLEAGLLLGEGIKVSVGLGVIGVNFFEPRQGVDGLLHPFFYIAPDVFFAVQLRLLWQVTDLDIGLGARLAQNVGIDARHNLE